MFPELLESSLYFEWRLSTILNKQGRVRAATFHGNTIAFMGSPTASSGQMNLPSGGSQSSSQVAASNHESAYRRGGTFAADPLECFVWVTMFRASLLSIDDSSLLLCVLNRS